MRRLVMVAVATAAVGGLPGCSPGRVAESMRVLADISAGEGPSALKETTSAPGRRPVAFEVDGRRHRADLYLPADGALAGMVLVPGIAPAGRDDPRLVAFANTLARTRFEVLVPDLPRLRALRVGGDDARVLADAAIHLDRRSAGRPLAMTAISFAAGPAAAALFEPDIKGRVAMLITVGGYYDLEAVITFFTTGNYRAGAGAPWRYRRPNAYGKWVFVLSNAPRLDDPADALALEAMARRKIEDPDADVSDLSEGLGPEGRTVDALLANRDPDRVPALIAALPPAIVAEIHALDLSRRDLRAVDARFVLVHARDDPIIPETESIAFAAAAAPGKAEFFVLDGLHHVDAGGLGLADKLRLLDAVYMVLAFRDGAGRPADRKP
jgi:pimeloyl-ACP methyl ester carboxylesterase